MVKVIKNLFTKAKESGSDPHMAMLCLRTTTVSHELPPPCVLLNGRNYKGNLPTKTRQAELFTRELQQRQDRQRTQHDKRASKDQADLHPDDLVRVQNPITKQWAPGRITGATGAPRSYNVQTPTGTYRRNRRHLRRSREEFSHRQLLPQPTLDDDDPADDDATPATANAADVPPIAPSPPPLRQSSRVRKPVHRLNL
jgi:hypothetical protein